MVIPIWSDGIDFGHRALGDAGGQQSRSVGKAVRAYITNFGGDGVSVVDPINDVLVANIPTGAKPHGVAIAPDGRAVYVSNEGSGTVSVIDPATNKVTATWKAVQAQINWKFRQTVRMSS